MGQRTEKLLSDSRTPPITARNTEGISRCRIPARVPPSDLAMHINHGNEGQEAGRFRRSDPLDITRNARESIEEASEARRAEETRAKEEALRSRQNPKDAVELSRSAQHLAAAEEVEAQAEHSPERAELVEELRKQYEAKSLNTAERIEDAAEAMLMSRDS